MYFTELLKPCRFTHVHEEIWGSFRQLLGCELPTSEGPRYTQLSKFIPKILVMENVIQEIQGSQSTTVVCSWCINVLHLSAYVCPLPLPWHCLQWTRLNSRQPKGCWSLFFCPVVLIMFNLIHCKGKWDVNIL